MLFPAAILATFVTSYQVVIQKLLRRWGGEDFDYCYLIVPLFFYLLWEMGKGDKQALPRSLGSSGPLSPKGAVPAISQGSTNRGFKFGELSWSIWGLIPIGVSMLAILVGELGSIETLMYLGLWGSVMGIFGCLYGARARKLIFPLGILLFAVPLPSFLNQVGTFQLKLAASSLAAQMLMLSGVSVFREGNIIDIGISQLQVVDACSGLRYLMPLLLLALLVGHFFSRRWWRRTVLILMVGPLSVVLNAFRIWLTGVLTVTGHAYLTQDFSHDLTGWLIFGIAAIILSGMTMLMNRVGKDSGAMPHTDQGAKPTGILRRASLTAAICIFFAGSGWAIHKIPNPSNLPVRASLGNFPMQIGEWVGQRGYIPKEIMNNLWADDCVTASYQNHRLNNIIHLLIPFYEYQGTFHTAHAPDSCLLGSGWSKISSAARSVKIDGNVALPTETMIMEKEGSRILSSYFFLQRGRVITSPWMNKFYLIYDALARRRTDGALVRVEMTLARDQTEDEAFPILESFVADLWKILPEYVPN